MYNIKANLSYPVINVGSRNKPSYLPVDVCTVEAGQPAKSKLNPNQASAMIKFAVRSPGENADSVVKEGPEVLGLQPDLRGTPVRKTPTFLVHGRI